MTPAHQARHAAAIARGDFLPWRTATDARNRATEIQLRRVMADNPASPPALRRFHARQLAEAVTRYGTDSPDALAARPPRPPSPFSRFIEALTNDNQPNQ